jgi:predicted O-methyltransferase YrrM
MDTRIDDVLKEYEQRAAAEEPIVAELHATGQMVQRRDEFLLAVGRSTGTFLHTLVCDSGATRILEIGASYGYSTIWLADAARVTGGRVTSLERHPDKVAYGRGQLARVGLLDYVDVHVGDARDTIASLPGPFDFVLLDLWKDLYIACFDLVYPKLAEGAVVVADNMLFPPAAGPAAREYRQHVRQQRDLDTVLLPLGQGLAISRYRAQ